MKLLILATVLLCAAAPSDRRAQKFFETAEKHYRVGEFELALENYKKAYEILPEPAFLFNMGQCHRNMAQYERALFFFRSYLAEAKNPPDRRGVEALIRALEEKLANAPPPAPTETATRAAQLELQPRPPPLVVTATEEPDDTEWYEHWLFWTLLGASVVAAASGVAIAAGSGDDILDGVPEGATIVRVP